MSEQLDVLKVLASRLDAAGVSYMVTGSIAAGIYGQPRMTRDIDIVAELVRPHAAKLPRILGPDFDCDAEAAADAIANRRMFSVFQSTALQKVDLIVLDRERDYEIEKFSRRRQVDVDGHRIWVIAPEDLVLSKLLWAKESPSELQERDVRAILTIQTSLDWSYLDLWARRLTVAAGLARLRT